MSYLSDFQELNGGYVAFGGNPKGGNILGKEKIKTDKLDFEDVYFVKELKFNLFSVSQMCDKKNKVLFTDSECLVLSPDFKLLDESQVLLRVPKENNMYNVNLKDIVLSGDLTCLFAKATIDESNLWHRRLRHVNFKTINKLVRGKFEGKVDEGFLAGYSVISKAFRVFNSRTRIIQETLHVNFLENKPNITGTGPTWLFDIDSLTRTMNYQPVTTGNQSNPSVGFQEEFLAEKAGDEVNQQYMPFPVWSTGSSNPQNKEGDAAFDGKSPVEYFTGNRDFNADFEDYSEDSSNNVSAVGPIVPTTGQNYSNSTNPISAAGPSNTNTSPTHGNSSLQDASQPLEMLEREDIAYFDHENVGAEADFNNLETSITLGIKQDLSLKDTQEEGINYEEVFAPVARIKAIRLFLAYASFMGFIGYQMDVKSAFLYGTIEEEVYICQPLGFEDPDYPDKVYKVVKALYGLHQAPRSCQDKYVAEILKKFGLTKGKSGSTPIDTEKPLLKDLNGEDVDVHIYRSIISSFMYLTSSRPDIMFAVCACARFQVTPKVSHLHAVKRIFRYLKGKPHLGLWYPKDSPFDLVAYSDSDYAGASLDKKSTNRGCQFLGCRLISWQCKKQTVVATSSTEAEYVAGASCCAQVLWIQNQMLDYGKSDASEGFNQIIDFLNGSYIELQALVGKKKVVVTEAAIRDALHLDDAEGVDCLPNEEIFTELARMGYEKPSTKLTFYKAFLSSQWKLLIYIILHLVRNVDISSKFHMYPRFIHLIIQNQLGDLSTHTTKYISPALTQKVFANMRRVGKGCSGVETPLFEGMLVAIEPEEQGDVEEHGNDDNVAEEPITAVSEDDVENQYIPSPTSPTPPPQQPQDIPSRSQAQSPLPQPQSPTPAPTQGVDFPMKITKLKTRVKKLERANKVKTLKLRRLRKVGTSQRVDTSYDIVMEDVSNQGRMIDELDKDEGAVLMNEKEETKEVKDITGDAQVEGRQAEIYQIDMDHVAKVLSMQEDEPEIQEAVEVVTTTKLITKVVVAVSETVNAATIVPTITAAVVPTVTVAPVKIEEEENRAIASINETPAQKTSKRRRLNEEAEDVEELKQHLEIVPDEDDDVYTEATPLARKVPVVDYQIIQLNNKPHFKIIRADGTHQLYVSFITLLKNFDREDLESLWSIVKERFATSKPNNFSNDFLLTTLRAMFGRPDGQD
nr:uncharacterized mitochondrial protein AtMg00810-like [Tanacetum cinerariifolium]